MANKYNNTIDCLPHMTADNENRHQFAGFLHYFLAFKNYIDAYEISMDKTIPLDILTLASQLKVHIDAQIQTLDVEIHEAMMHLCAMMENYISHRCAETK